MILNDEDRTRLRELRDYAERNPISAVRVVAMAIGQAASVVGSDPAHRAYLSQGVTAIFSLEDYTLISAELATPELRARGRVRHASISKHEILRPMKRGSVVPSPELVAEIADQLGFTDARVVFASPDSAGPLIQHVLEDAP